MGSDPGESLDVLTLPAAGHVAIRGGITRLVGYGAGTVLGTATSILLLRYLGVRDYGRYATVTAIAGVVGALADLGMGTVVERDYVVVDQQAARRGLIADLVGLRLAITPIAASIAIGLTAAAGYSATMVAGVAIGAIGVLLTLLYLSVLIPATASMRFVAITGVGFVRDVANAVGLVALVVVGAGLLPFFAVPTMAALAAFGASLRIAGRKSISAHFEWTKWKPLIVESLPLGLAAVIGVLYLRALLILTSLATSSVSTGLYAMSDRVIQVLVGGAAVMISAAFPIVARAGGRDDEARLAYALQQLFDAVVFAAILGVLVFAIAAKPIVVLLGGSAYAGSAPLLRIQCFALFGSFLCCVWLPTLIAIHRQRSLIAINLAGLLTIALVGGSLIPTFGVTGTAVAAALGETAIAAAGLIALIRARPALRPRLGAAAKLLGGGATCATLAFVPGLPAAGAAALAAVGYVSLAWFTGAVPRDPVDALLALGRRGGVPRP